MECDEVLSRLWEYLDHELGPEEAQAIRVHLSDCSGCYPDFCWGRAFLALLARQRDRCSAPAGLVKWAWTWRMSGSQ